MTKSKAHKYWNRFTGWASHEGTVQVEVPRALEEFLVAPDRVPADARQQVQQLFECWFLLDRRLIASGLTPLEAFQRSQERRFKPAEREIYARFAQGSRFGFFRVEEVQPGERLTLRLMPGQDSFRVVDIAASEGAAQGDYLITRIFPFSDHWVIEGFSAIFPADGAYALDRIFGGSKPERGDLRPRQALELFMPKVDWERESLPRVKARLAMLLQRWGVSDITASAVEEAIRTAHERRDMSHPLFKGVLDRAPSADEAGEAAAVLTAWWNLTLPDKRPEFGPKETELIADLQRVIGQKLAGRDLSDPVEAERFAEAVAQEWYAAPQKELAGRTPEQVMVEERKTLGIQREGIGFKILPSELHPGGEREREGARFAAEARRHLLKKDAAKALECLEKAYAALKGHEGAFRLLGNMATAQVMLGRRDEALELLRAALKVNPDYAVARDNLRLLEGMPPREFKAKHRAGFFENTNVVTED